MTQLVQFKNNASATLLAGITNVATAISLTAGQGANFPALAAGQYFRATLKDTANNLEIVKVTARAVDDLTVIRAQEGTTGRAYSALDTIELRITAQDLADLHDQAGNAPDRITAGTSKATPVDADAFALSDSAAPTTPSKLTWANLKATLKAYFDTLYGSSRTQEGITQFFYPSADNPYRDMYRAGWLPSWFQPQHGGAQWGNMPNGSFGSVATGNVQDDASGYVGDAAASYYRSQGFKVSEGITSPTIWLKLYKVGNPTTALSVSIYSDTAGTPNAVIGGSATIVAKLIASRSDGEWYAVTPTPGALTAGVQYHIVFTATNTDASNYYGFRYTAVRKYPFGFINYATSAPVWTQAANAAVCFLIQNPAANSLIQSGGMFDYKLAFNNGSPVSQSRSVTQPLSNFYDGKNCSVLHRGTTVASSNVLDFVYGVDHDRITITTNASNFPVLSIYRSDRTLAQITGTVVATKDIGFRIRTVGDGADYATLYADGASTGTPLTAQTFSMDVNMALLGTARLGDGFGIIPAWTQDMQMTSLPSAQGWTYTTAATPLEAAAMSIQGGKLYLNASAYAAAEYGYYTKTTVFVNGTGWSVDFKFRCPKANNSTGTPNNGVLTLADGTKRVDIAIHEYFLSIGNTAATDFIVQGDFQSRERVFQLRGKGSDYYLFIDGKLAVDGTGKLLTASAANRIDFGDVSAVSGENWDAIWSYVKYYQGGMLLPIANSGSCSEFVHWSGDKSALFPSLWNSGAPVSVKQACGVPRNYIGEGAVQREMRRGVSQSPTTSSATPTVLSEMECFVIGSSVDVDGSSPDSNATVGAYTANSINIDSKFSGQQGISTSAIANAYGATSVKSVVGVPLGLHKVELRWYCSAGTSTSSGTSRGLSVEARS